MTMFSDCLECGAQVEINKMPYPGKFFQSGPTEHEDGNSVICKNKHEFVPKEYYVKSA